MGEDGDSPERVRRRSVVTEREANLVVDWQSPPSQTIANMVSVTYRPAYQMVDGKRQPMDRSQCQLEAGGKWPTASNVYSYPLWQSDSTDFGGIGGVGMRQYYFVVKSLATYFLAAGVASLPAILAYSDGKMYDHPASSRFKDAVGARQSLGNLVVTDADMEAGRSYELWLASATNAAVAVSGVVYALWINKRMAKNAIECDANHVTMSDYTVEIKPCAGKHWNQFQVDEHHDKEHQRNALKQEIVEHLKADPELSKDDSLIAQIGGKDCIWVAWDNKEQIKLWRKKKQLLLSLEAALYENHHRGNNDGDGQISDLQAVGKVAGELELLNAQLAALEPGGEKRQRWRPVTVFVVFDSDDNYQRSIETVQHITVGGRKCKIKSAPEPETLMWEHLEYSARSRHFRNMLIFALTAAMLTVGVWLMLKSNELKEVLSYLNSCHYVLGPQAESPKNDAFCPGALTGDNGTASIYRSAYTTLKVPHTCCACLTLRSIPRMNFVWTTMRMEIYKQCVVTAFVLQMCARACSFLIHTHP